MNVIIYRNIVTRKSVTMNTSKPKKFAQETRRKLLKQVNGKLEHVLSADNGALRDKTHVLYDLKKELKRMGRDTLVDKVAYTWFNRFAALRYMDARGYQPLEISILHLWKDRFHRRSYRKRWRGISPMS